MGKQTDGLMKTIYIPGAYFVCWAYKSLFYDKIGKVLGQLKYGDTVCDRPRIVNLHGYCPS